MWVLLKPPRFGGAKSCKTITTIGLDIAKSVFQVHGVDNDGKVVIRRQLKRRYVLAFFEKLQLCLVGIECLVTPLVTRAAGTWPYGAANAAGLREALRQTTESVRFRRFGRSNSRSPAAKSGGS
jgi:transposase